MVTAIERKRPLRSPLSALAGLAAVMARVPTETADELCSAMAISPSPGGFRSSLNNDGTPLQICIGLNRAGMPPAIRLIADPAAASRDGAEQVRSVERALGNVLASHAPQMAPLCHQVLDRILPPDLAARVALGNGGAWLAAALGGRGLALYATTKWGDPAARWTRALEWLEGILPDSAMAREALGRLSPHATPISAGVEGTTPSNSRAKLYWRLERAVGMRALRIPLLARPEMAEFLACAVADRRIAISSIVGSISFQLNSGDVSDVKLDLCGHCVDRPWPDWIDILGRCSVRFGLAEFPLAGLGPEPDAELAFIGFGLGSNLAPRLNVYLKPKGARRSSLS